VLCGDGSGDVEMGRWRWQNVRVALRCGGLGVGGEEGSGDGRGEGIGESLGRVAVEAAGNAVSAAAARGCGSGGGLGLDWIRFVAAPPPPLVWVGVGGSKVCCDFISSRKQQRQHSDNRLRTLLPILTSYQSSYKWP